MCTYIYNTYACIHTYIPTYLPTYIYIYIYIHTYTHICRRVAHRGERCVSPARERGEPQREIQSSIYIYIYI